MLDWTEYEPGTGSTEDLFAEFMGVKPKAKRPPPKPITDTSTDINRCTPEQAAAIAEMYRGIRDFSALTFAEAILFDNGETGRPRGKPRYQIKLNWSEADPDEIRQFKRSQQCRTRFIPLTVREQARDNWHRKTKVQGQFRFEPEEQRTIGMLLDMMKQLDRAQEGPKSMIGVLQHWVKSKGKIRHSTFGLLTWSRTPDAWLPNLTLVKSMTGEMMTTRTAAGEPIEAIQMRPGKGTNVLAYGVHYSDAMLNHMKSDVMIKSAIQDMADEELPF